MKSFLYASISAVSLMLTACADNSAQDAVDAIAQNLQISYAVTHNRVGETCRLPNGTGALESDCYEAVISLTSPADISGGPWDIYFSQVEPLFSYQSDSFTVERVNGDLHRIRANADFTGFKAGQSLTIPIIVKGLNLTESKLMPNYYVVSEGARAKTIDSTRLTKDPQTGLTVRPYVVPMDIANTFHRGEGDNTPYADAAFLYKANMGVTPAPQNILDTGIVPKPSALTLSKDAARLDISNGINIVADRDIVGNIDSALARLKTLGLSQSKSGAPVEINIAKSKTPQAEAYSLTISKAGIDIVAADKAGAYYALMSLAGLLGAQDNTLPALTITDAPRYGFRGLHIDVGRNFHDKDEIIKFMDQMAAYKLNKLHLHMGEDEGWRLEIPGLPELTDIGSKRCHDLSEDTCLLMQLGSGPDANSEVNGYYSVADYTQILKAATARHIEVIPSLDMPGHARAAIKSMEARYRKLIAAGDEAGARQYLLSDPEDKSEYTSIQFYNDNTINPCMDSTFVFLEKMIDEVEKMHMDAGHPLRRYHIGADETAGAWTASPACEAFFKSNNAGITKPDQLGTYLIERMANMLAARGMIAGAWSDGIEHANFDNLPPNLQSNIWAALPWGGASPAHKHANQGWDVVLSYPDVMYFDFPYEADPKEDGYDWAARHVNTRKVFNFMPGNAPIHAEFWGDSTENSFAVDDQLQKDDDGAITHSPLQKGIKYAGIQGQIWSETVPNDDLLEYHVFPRFLALAERAWSTAQWEVPYNYAGGIYSRDTDAFTKPAQAVRDADWARFASLVGAKEMFKLDKAGIFYRVPTVGAIIEGGVLKANIAFPGLAIEYREDGGKWRAYNGETQVKAGVDIRARSANGQRAGRSLHVKYNP